MARLMEVRKYVEEYPGEADGGGSLFVGACFRDRVKGETAQSVVGGFVRIWDDGGVGRGMQFDNALDAQTWKHEKLECWVEEVEPEDGERRFRTVVLFEVLTDDELRALIEVLDAELDRDERRETLQDGTLQRMLRAASQEHAARAKRLVARP
jgi:hypothetical protein